MSLDGRVSARLSTQTPESHEGDGHTCSRDGGDIDSHPDVALYECGNCCRKSEDVHDDNDGFQKTGAVWGGSHFAVISAVEAFVSARH